MSLADVLKANPPKMPKGLEDKDIEKALSKLEKEFAAFQAVAKAFSYECGKMSPAVGDADSVIVKKAGDRNLDPAKKKAMDELYKSMKTFAKVFTSL